MAFALREKLDHARTAHEQATIRDGGITTGSTREAYVKALREFNDLKLRGVIPERLRE